jgi:hypothetical protein
VNHVEEQYDRKVRERQAFQRQYLKLGKLSNEDCRNEHLQYLKAQAKANRVERRNMVSEFSQVSSALPGFIGMLPCNNDRQQLKTIQRSLKLFGQQASPRLKSSFEAGRSEELKAVHNVSKSHEKTITAIPL